MLFCNSVFYRR